MSENKNWKLMHCMDTSYFHFEILLLLYFEVQLISNESFRFRRIGYTDINDLKFLLDSERKKKWSHFYLKSWVTCGTKICPGIPSNWRIFWVKLNWFWESISNLTQIFFNYSESRGRILVPLVTQLFGQNDYILFFSVVTSSKVSKQSSYNVCC